jgi:prepilin-type N-terminal cleavage/methylation domain-containing protein
MKRQIKYQANAGFTLVEVMVCVFVIAIFCIPLFRGFNLSALNNSRAHHTQMATTYAQKKLELLMAARLDTNDRGGAAGPLDELQAQFESLLIDSSAAYDPATFSADPNDAAVVALRADVISGYGDEIYDKPKFDHLFTPLIFTQNGIEVGGRRYNMEVLIDPTPYSWDDETYMTVTGGSDYYEDTDSQIEVYNSNVLRRAPIDNIGPEFATIDGTYTNPLDEINIESGPLNALFYSAVNAGAAALADEAAVKQAMYKNMRKEIFVRIAEAGTPGYIRVTSYVKYSVTYGGVYCEWNSPNEYFGEFPLARSSDGQSWDSGGKIYIFAKAFRVSGTGYTSWLGSENMSTDAETGGNFITITNTVSSDFSDGYPLDIYLVREYYQTLAGAYVASDNFREVSINGTPYYTYPPSGGAADLLTGAKEIVAGGITTNLRTNIKGKIGDSSGLTLLEADAKATVVGEEEPRLRNYRITVTLTDPSSGKVMAQVTSTKRVI